MGSLPSSFDFLPLLGPQDDRFHGSVLTLLDDSACRILHSGLLYTPVLLRRGYIRLTASSCPERPFPPPDRGGILGGPAVLVGDKERRQGFAHRRHRHRGYVRGGDGGAGSRTP